MKYSKPNFEYEWSEALRYREFEKMGKDEWLKKASKDFEICNFNSIKENDEITIRVIGQRYELNDEHVSIIGEIVEPKVERARPKGKLDTKKKPKLVITENI